MSAGEGIHLCYDGLHLFPQLLAVDEQILLAVQV